jgi:hypothetical protein
MTDKEFLDVNEILKERIRLGIDIHPSDIELKRFQAIAKGIDSERYFTIYGCQSCVQALVKFVFENYKEMVTVFTLPDDVEEIVKPKNVKNGKAKSN